MVANLGTRRRSTRLRAQRTPLSWLQFKQDKLVPAFKELREGGIFARTTNIACCASCTHDELGSIVYDSEGDGEWNGYVGYHMQSVPMPFKEDWLKPFDRIYLQHALPYDDPNVVTLVRDVFVKRGLAVEWEGDPTKTILVRLPTSIGPLWQKLRAHVKQRSIFYYWHGLTHHLHATGDEESDKRQRSNITYDPDAPDALPPGLDDCFNDLQFNRSMTFESPWNGRALKRDGLWKGYPDTPFAAHLLRTNASLEDIHAEWKINLENYWNGGDLKSLKLDCPTRFDDCTEVVLKGAELDAIAFRGAKVVFASYDTLDGDFTSTKEYNAPAGNCFTIAELHRVLEKHLKWIAKCEQRQNKLKMDRCFFEELYAREDGALVVRWGA